MFLPKSHTDSNRQRVNPTFWIKERIIRNFSSACFHQLSLFLLVGLLFCSKIGAQDLQFTHLDDIDGFPLGSPLCLLQDQQGFVWIGTTDGVYRYDGRQFRSFRHNPRDSTSLSHNYVRALMEGKDGTIWMGTNEGFCSFDPKTETFIRYQCEGELTPQGTNHILSMEEDHRGNIWVGTYQGAYCFGPDRTSITHHLPDTSRRDRLQNGTVWEIYEDRQQRLWFGTNAGIARQAPDDTINFKTFLPDPSQPFALKTERIWKFVEQADGTLWGGSDYGVFRVEELDDDSTQFVFYSHESDNANSLSYNFINDLYVDRYDDLWAATWRGGLNRVEYSSEAPENIQFTSYQHQNDDLNSIRFDNITTVLADDSGIIWIGTQLGIDLIIPSANNFKSIRASSSAAFGLSNEIVKAVVRDRAGNLWIGTYNGLNFLSAENFAAREFQFTSFYHQLEDPNSLSHNNIYCLYEDQRGTIWVGTYNGLNYIEYDKDGQVVFRKFDTTNGLPHQFIYGIEQASDSVYWVNTYGQLSRMTFDPANPDQTRFVNYDMDPSRADALINATTYQVEKDRFGDYWIGTYIGMSKLLDEKQPGRFENYHPQPNNLHGLQGKMVRHLHLDRAGRMWIGTRKGLHALIQEERDVPAELRHFGMSYGLPNDVIRMITEDQSGQLWIGTNFGLIAFDPDAASAGEPGVKAIYHQSDGLISDVFMSAYADEEGWLFLGTPKGLQFFKPDSMIVHEQVPRMAFTDLKVFNESVYPGIGEKSILQNAINYTETLTLAYWQDIFTIEFAGLDFANPRKNQYAYQLVGFDQDWVHCGNRNSATYTNLDPGDYTFQVKGSNGDGFWNDVPLELKVRILPPYWRTWWAYLFYVVLAGLGIYALIWFRLRQQRQRLETQRRLVAARYEERAQLRQQNAADFHDELGHRITRISLFLELAEREVQSHQGLSNYLQKVKENTTELAGGIRDLIWSLDPQKDSLSQTLLRLQDFGDQLFAYSSVVFKREGQLDATMDRPLSPKTRKHLLLIFKEAMNNTLKYAQASEAILVTQWKGDQLQINYHDNGIGFDLSGATKGNGLKNMRQRAQKIGASLQIQSKLEQGTSIQLRMEIPQMG